MNHTCDSSDENDRDKSTMKNRMGWRRSLVMNRRGRKAEIYKKQRVEGKWRLIKKQRVEKVKLFEEPE